MSFYNMLFGQNPNSDQILECLGLKKDDVARFRDCYIGDDGSIAIYTRLGGGNRDSYKDEIKQLQSITGYIYDEDDDYDSTYATFYYRPTTGNENKRQGENDD